jgi:hypothetical protein
MSAYDMIFSDAIYGAEKSGRYVVEPRLYKMLDYEYNLLIERLKEKRSNTSCFFVFADTVAAKSFRNSKDCHGWLGIKFQTRPGGEPNYINLHVRMFDDQAVLQQEALGIVGVNLIYGAFYLRDQPAKFIQSLGDNLSQKRIEIDVVRFAGPDLEHFDNRLMSLEMMKSGLANVAIFENDDLIQPSEFLHKKAILIQRGSFRPVTNVNIDMMKCAKRRFSRQVGETKSEVLMEITLKNLHDEGEVNSTDFLARVDCLTAVGFRVMISNYPEHYSLMNYLSRFTSEPLAFVMGVPGLQSIFDDRYYEQLDGGVLEAIGKLFKRNVKFFIYPTLDDDGSIVNLASMDVRHEYRYLFQHLRDSGKLESLDDCELSNVHISTRNVLQMIRSESSSWESMVPAKVADLIRREKLFK